METFVTVTKTRKEEIYQEILPQIESLIAGESDLIANLANIVSVLKMAFPERISWVGFYLARNGELVLGPFQGKPACVRIGWGRGVCGKAAAEAKPVLVPNVEEFPGHIVCDPDSRSEVVVPVLRGNEVLGVLDVDSGRLNAFDQVDTKYLLKVVNLAAQKF